MADLEQSKILVIGDYKSYKTLNVSKKNTV